MVDRAAYLHEVLDGIQRAFSIMRTTHPEVVIYTIGIWTDVAARKSAIAFDTLRNSELKRNAAKTFRRQLRERCIAAGDTKRASLVPADMVRNNNPADFEFRSVVVVDNESLSDAKQGNHEDMAAIESVLGQLKLMAAKTAQHLNLHPEAELGISGRNSWYQHAVKIADAISEPDDDDEARRGT